MPDSSRIARTKRTRKRRAASFTPAELEWLTGEPKPGANKFWRFRYARDFDALAELLERAAAAGIIGDERLVELRAAVQGGRPMSFGGS